MDTLVLTNQDYAIMISDVFHQFINTQQQFKSTVDMMFTLFTYPYIHINERSKQPITTNIKQHTNISDFATYINRCILTNQWNILSILPSDYKLIIPSDYDKTVAFHEELLENDEYDDELITVHDIIKTIEPIDENNKELMVTEFVIAPPIPQHNNYLIDNEYMTFDDDEEVIVEGGDDEDVDLFFCDSTVDKTYIDDVASFVVSSSSSDDDSVKVSHKVNNNVNNVSASSTQQTTQQQTQQPRTTSPSTSAQQLSSSSSTNQFNTINCTGHMIQSLTQNIATIPVGEYTYTQQTYHNPSTQSYQPQFADQYQQSSRTQIVRSTLEETRQLYSNFMF